MKVRWTPRAREGFRRQTRYIAKDSPAAARQVSARVRSAVNGLPTYPLKGRAGRVIGTRELVVPHTPFTVAYRVTEQIVEIVGVIHQAQQWPASFN